MKFAFFTKTDWSEAPRLRHQVARLLAAQGHDVLFFQNPTLRGNGAPAHPEPHIETRRLRYLLHWQLRANRVMSRANAVVEKREILRAVPPQLGLPIINFNFDYEFLRELYPTHRIVTIINDDFVTSARPWARRESERTLAETARSSDANLVVSYPLRDQLLPFTDKVELFFPWARVPYRKPAPGVRKDLLYWGYINDRVDSELVVGLLDAGRRVHLVGPVADSPRVRRMTEHRNAVVYGSKTIGEIEDVIAQCCASIAPYDVAYRYIAATTVSNRTFDLLAAGLPMIFSNLPALLESPRGVLYRTKSVDELVAAADEAERTFSDVQPAIESFLAAHTPELRYQQLMRHFEGVA